MKKKILTFLIVPLYNAIALYTLTAGYYVHNWYIALLPEQSTLVSMTEFIFGFIGFCYFIVFMAGECISFMFSFYCFANNRAPDYESLRAFFESR